MNKINPYKKIIDLLKEKKINFTEIKHVPIYTMEDSVKATGLSLCRNRSKGFVIKIG